MWLLRKLTRPDTTSLALDARGLDHARPFPQVLADELAEPIRAERKRRYLLLGELLDDCGSCMIASVSWESRSTISFGVRTGATMPTHGAISNPGTVSATAGRSGSAGMRLGSATASATNWPA